MIVLANVILQFHLFVASFDSESQMIRISNLPDALQKDRVIVEGLTVDGRQEVSPSDAHLIERAAPPHEPYSEAFELSPRFFRNETDIFPYFIHLL